MNGWSYIQMHKPCNNFLVSYLMELSGSVGRLLDLEFKGREFETQRRHFVVSLSKTLYRLLSTGST